MPRLDAGRMIGDVMNDNGGLAQVIDLAAERARRHPGKIGEPEPPATLAALAS